MSNHPQASLKHLIGWETDGRFCRFEYDRRSNACLAHLTRRFETALNCIRWSFGRERKHGHDNQFFTRVARAHCLLQCLHPIVAVGKYRPFSNNDKLTLEAPLKLRVVESPLEIGNRLVPDGLPRLA